MKVGLIVPVYNEEQNFNPAFAEALLDPNCVVDTTVWVDDGSTDGGLVLPDDPSFCFIRHEKNEGKTQTVRDGFERLKEMGASVVGMIDADWQHIYSQIDPAGQNQRWDAPARRLVRSTLRKPTTVQTGEIKEVFLNNINGLFAPLFEDENLVMSTRRFARNRLVDLFTDGAGGIYSGNRAIRADRLEHMYGIYDKLGIDIPGWANEAAIVAYMKTEFGRDMGDYCVSTMMRDVVNVGSRRKAGDLLGGLGRMASIHATAIRYEMVFARKLGNAKMLGDYPEFTIAA